MNTDTQPTVPTPDGAANLAAELDLHIGQPNQRGSVGIGSDAYYVYFWRNQRKPAILTWDDLPVIYHMGGGKPRAFGE
jgi:hypothetical protein